MTKFGTCRTCAIRTNHPQNPVQSICGLSKREIPNMTEDKCPWYIDQTTVRTCDICGNAYENLIIDITNGTPKYICEKCSSRFGTCYMCKNSNICGFSADQTTPDMVMRQMRQGNMIAQVQVKNPDKVDIYCTKCCCWNKEEKYCFKEEAGTCGGYVENAI